MLIVGGILTWQYLLEMLQEKGEIKEPAFKKLELNLTTTKLATIPGHYDVGFIVFSPNGQHVAYEATKEGKSFVVVDGKEGKLYDRVSYLAFSPDSQHFAYVAKEKGKYFAVVNGKEGKAYDGVWGDIFGGLTFSPNSRHLAYQAEKNGKRFMVVDAKEYGPYFMIDSSPVFSPDSKHLAYVAWREGKAFMVVDNKEGPAYGDIISGIISPPVFSSDSKNIAYAVRKEGKWVLVINNKESEVYDYDAIGGFVFGPDNKQIIAYIAREEFRPFAIIKGKRHKDYELVSDIKFSPDYERAAYAATIALLDPLTPKQESVVIIDGEEGKIYDSVWDPVFSPDSKHVAYVAAKGEWLTEERQFIIVVDNREISAHTFIDSKSIIFSPDSKYICYGAQIGNELWWIVDEVK